MQWQQKARIMRWAVRLPGGHTLYRWGQRRIGRMHASPMQRLPQVICLAQQLKRAGMTLDGKSAFEVGTGYKPVMPVTLFLLGATPVYTFDIVAGLDWKLTQAMLAWFAAHSAQLLTLFEGLVASDVLNERLALLNRYVTSPRTFFEQAQILYCAPADAGQTELPDNSLDVHVSTTTLEHIPPDALPVLLAEAYRLLRPDGLAAHQIDLGDHFAQQDESISLIHFLRYSDAEWQSLAGNRYAYCNRLRRPDYEAMFAACGFEIIAADISVDARSLAALDNGFRPIARFEMYTPEVLATTRMEVILHKSSKRQQG